MPESIHDKQVFSLSDVAMSIQRAIADRYKSVYWVKAEMNKLNFYRQSGHCYPELVEKKNGRVVAQLRGVLWRDDFIRINSNFERVLNEPLKDGIKILMQVRINFDAVHGLSLSIIDIDPSFTLGDLEKEKQEALSRLKAEGIFDQNKALPFPLLPQRIAIISVESSKGYADFTKVIENNPGNYKFFYYLFPSLLQGDNAVQAIITQLNRIKKVKHHFDVVAIIRGGGGDIGLSCYNSYALAKEIALFPIPVLTGIGHATNETVAEMISFSNAITPTKLAEYLLQKFNDFSFPVTEAERKITERAIRLLEDEHLKCDSILKLFRSVTGNIIISNRHEIRNLGNSLQQHSKFAFRNQGQGLRSARETLENETRLFTASRKAVLRDLAREIRKDSISRINHFKLMVAGLKERLSVHSLLKTKSDTLQIEHIEKNIGNMSPANVLKRGYSITLHNGKVVKHPEQLKSGDKLTTIIAEGEVQSTVNNSNKTKE